MFDLSSRLFKHLDFSSDRLYLHVTHPLCQNFRHVWWRPSTGNETSGSGRNASGGACSLKKRQGCGENIWLIAKHFPMSCRHTNTSFDSMAHDIRLEHKAYAFVPSSFSFTSPPRTQSSTYDRHCGRCHMTHAPEQAQHAIDSNSNPVAPRTTPLSTTVHPALRFLPHFCCVFFIPRTNVAVTAP